MLFSHPFRSIMLIINRQLVDIGNDEEHKKAIIIRQTINDKDKDTSKRFVSFPIGSTVVIQWEDGGL